VTVVVLEPSRCDGRHIYSWHNWHTLDSSIVRILLRVVVAITTLVLVVQLHSREHVEPL